MALDVLRGIRPEVQLLGHMVSPCSVFRGIAVPLPEHLQQQHAVALVSLPLGQCLLFSFLLIIAIDANRHKVSRSGFKTLRCLSGGSLCQDTSGAVG